MALQIRRGTNAERLTITPLQGELIFTTDTEKVFVGDGTTLGGVAISTDTNSEDVQDIVAPMFTGGTHTGISFSYNDGSGTINATVSGGGGGSGTVTSVSVASANGFTGSVANPTTTPAITLATSITGVLKGNGTAISAAVAGSDYQAPISLTTTGSSGAATLIGNTLNIPEYAGGGGASTLDDLTDVTITGSPANGEILRYDFGTSQWTNQTFVGNSYKIGITADDNSVILNHVTKAITLASGNITTLDVSNISRVGTISVSGNLLINDEANFTTNSDSRRLVSFSGYHNTDSSSTVVFRRGRGTLASPTSVQSADKLTELEFNAHIPSGEVANAARIKVFADDAVPVSASGNTTPGKIEFYTSGALGSSNIALSIDHKQQTSLYSVAAENSPLRIVTAHDSAIEGSNFLMLRQRGTISVPQIVQSNDIIHDMFFSGWDGSQYTAAVRIRGKAIGTPAVGNIPGRLELTVRSQVNGLMQNAIVLTGDRVILSRMPNLPTFADQTAAEASLPVGGLTVGMMYYDTALNKIRGYVSGGWVDLH